MKKGQALVEFVIILPIFLFLLLSIIDVGRIMYNKITLENEISEVINLYQGGKKKEEIQDKLNLDSQLSWKEQDEYIEFTLNKEVDLITPGINLIFDDPYQVLVKRSIFNE